MLARIETPLLRILRDEGRTQAWLARRLGVTRARVGQWCHGINVPVPETQAAIANALGRTTGELWPSESEESEAA